MQSKLLGSGNDVVLKLLLCFARHILEQLLCFLKRDFQGMNKLVESTDSFFLPKVQFDHHVVGMKHALVE